MSGSREVTGHYQVDVLLTAQLSYKTIQKCKCRVLMPEESVELRMKPPRFQEFRSEVTGHYQVDVLLTAQLSYKTIQKCKCRVLMPEESVELRMKPPRFQEFRVA